MITTLIFDLDGTIADTEELHFQAWQQTLLDHGVPEFTFEDFLRYVGTSNEKVANDHCTAYQLGVEEKALIRYKQDLYMKLIPQVQLCTGARELIELCSSHFTMAVASSSHQREVHAILESQGLLKHFKVIVCGDMVILKKPDPEIYLKAASELGVRPQECIAFEDTEHGLNAAKSADMYGVAIPTLFSKNHDFTRADICIQSLAEMNIDFIQEIQR